MPRASSLGSALCSFTTCSSVNAMTVFISRHLGPHARPCTRHFTRSISFNPITTSEAYYAPLQTGMRKSRRFDQRTQATQLVSGTPRLSSGSLTPELPLYHFLTANPPPPQPDPEFREDGDSACLLHLGSSVPNGSQADRRLIKC